MQTLVLTPPTSETLKVVKVERSLERDDFDKFVKFSKQLSNIDGQFIQNPQNKLHLQNLSGIEYGRHLIDAPKDSNIKLHPKSCQKILKSTVERADYFHKNLIVSTIGLVLEPHQNKTLVTIPITDSRVETDTNNAREVVIDSSTINLFDHESRFVLGWFNNHHDLGSFLDSSNQLLASTLNLDEIHLCKGKVTTGISLDSARIFH